MQTFGLIVEGEYDEAVLRELILKCAGGNIEIISRLCGSAGALMNRFLGFLEEFRYVKQGEPVDKALVIRDADRKDPPELIEKMQSKIARRTYPFPVQFVIS
jgi:hypothetical protein